MCVCVCVCVCSRALRVCVRAHMQGGVDVCVQEYAVSLCVCVCS